MQHRRQQAFLKSVRERVARMRKENARMLEQNAELIRQNQQMREKHQRDMEHWIAEFQKLALQLHSESTTSEAGHHKPN